MPTDTSVQEQQKVKLKVPRHYVVVMLNDDFTTMEFVVNVLIEIFHKDPITAEAIMMDVHKKGRGIVGAYPRDIATTKVDEAMARAKAEGFPFRMTLEEA